MSIIFHIVPRSEWRSAVEEGEYRPGSLVDEGFIHLSGAEQVLQVAERVYNGQQDLILLCVDEDLLSADLRYELAEGREKYPHLYGPLNLDAVVAVIDFPARLDGGFTLPDGVRRLLDRHG
jgi:uncharacterized protein (DUF952 family)